MRLQDRLPWRITITLTFYTRSWAWSLMGTACLSASGLLYLPAHSLIESRGIPFHWCRRSQHLLVGFKVLCAVQFEQTLEISPAAGEVQIPLTVDGLRGYQFEKMSLYIYFCFFVFFSPAKVLF
ncbi:hypothetical protein XELAEV_18009900mg [Xenopus laevis]|uniref:Uncharacterized protein n=1 Tax=Xenopus laevis TaxID=8355 RepID=A0A974I194_XENLA|nr:hypothetical protein XELAEV_18009900mg [Xenopus laevis]